MHFSISNLILMGKVGKIVVANNIEKRALTYLFKIYLHLLNNLAIYLMLLMSPLSCP